MKLTHIITGLDTGGAETLLHALLARSDRERFQPEVVSLTDVGPIGERIRALGVPVRGLGMGRGKATPRDVLRLAAWLRVSSPALVMTWLYHANLVGGVAAKLAGNLPVAWGIHHTHLDPRKDKFSTILTARAGAPLSGVCVDRIIYCAESAREVHERLGYSRRKGVVISNGFDVETFAPDPASRLSLRDELGLSPEAQLVGLVARYSPYKDHATFVAAAARVAEAHPRARFVLCGDGVDPQNAELDRMLRETGLLARVHLLGRRGDMPRIHAALDLAVSSSCTEALPLAIGESMAAGVPCVVTDVGDSARLVGESGLAVAARSPEALAAGIDRLLSLAPEDRMRLGDAARARVSERFGFSAMIAQYEDVYQSLAPQL